MEEANALAEAIGHPPPYPDLEALAPNNGEEFLHDYYESQVSHVIYVYS